MMMIIFDLLKQMEHGFLYSKWLKAGLQAEIKTIKVNDIK